MGFFDKIKAGLTKTRAALSGALDDLFDNADKIDEDFYDELEETLILADLGASAAVLIVTTLRQRVFNNNIKSMEKAKEALKDI